MIHDLNQLNAFLAVIRYGSVGRAALELNMTQPTLTRVLQRLEQQVGARLFERTTTGMILTPYGETLRPYAQLLLSESANATREINVLRGLETGVVKVGAVSSAIEGIVPKAVGALLHKQPELQVRIVEGLSDELEELLAMGEIDLAVSLSVHESEELLLVCKSAWQEGCCVVAAVDHPLRMMPSLQLTDLVDQPWALPPRPRAPQQEWRQLFLAHGLPPPHVAVESNSHGAVRTLIAHSGFLGWLPRMLYAQHGSRIEALPVEGISTSRLFSVYRRRRGVMAPPTELLLEELRRIVIAMPPYSSKQPPQNIDPARGSF